jgi:hypothetical protein
MTLRTSFLLAAALVTGLTGPASAQDAAPTRVLEVREIRATAGKGEQVIAQGLEDLRRVLETIPLKTFELTNRLMGSGNVGKSAKVTFRDGTVLIVTVAQEISEGTYEIQTQMTYPGGTTTEAHDTVGPTGIMVLPGRRGQGYRMYYAIRMRKI